MGQAEVRGESPEDQPSPPVSQADIEHFERQVAQLIRHPKPLAVAIGLGHDDYPWWVTEYQLGLKNIELEIIQPGRAAPEGTNYAVATILEPIHLTTAGTVIWKTQQYELLWDRRLWYAEKIEERDAAGCKVRTAQDEIEIAALYRDDITPLKNRVDQELQAGLTGPLTQDRYKHLITLLNSLGAPDEVI